VSRLLDLFGLDPLHYSGLFSLDKDDGKGGGGNTDDEPDDDEKDEDTLPPPKDGKSYTQDEVDAILKRRLKRQETSLTKKITDAVTQQMKDAAAAAEADKDKTLEQKLADAQSKLERLGALEQIVGDFQETAEKRYKRMLKSLPETIQDLAPDQDVDIVTREKWLVEKGIPAADKLKADGKDEKKPAARGNNPDDPDPEADGDRKKKVDDLVNKYRGSGLYRGIG
jgi:hypothetical protein